MSRNHNALLISCLLTAACGNVRSDVSMRDFSAERTDEDTAPFATSSLGCADDTDCGCALDDAWLAQVFLKDPSMGDNDLAASLMRDGVLAPAETVSLSRDMQIGVDLHYRADADGFADILDGRDAHTIDGDQYRNLKMQDTDLFSDDFPFDEDAETLEGSATYTFALGADESSPGASPVDCYLTVVVDFDAITE